MEQTLTWAGIEGAVLPIIMAFAMRSRWPDWGRVLVSLAVYMAFGMATAFLNDDFTWRGVPVTAGTIVTAGFVTFQYLNKLGIIDRLEKMTNGGQEHP